MTTKVMMQKSTFILEFQVLASSGDS